jgi:nucleotide-binding universal stress UspA family protein
MAETAIEDALAIAETSGAELTLLRVIMPVSELLGPDGHPSGIDEQFELRRSHALTYLDRVRHRFGARAVTIHVDVEIGPASEAILVYARSHRTDLIVMSSHGRSGLSRWVLGSVTERVLRGAECAVLRVRPDEAAH